MEMGCGLSKIKVPCKGVGLVGGGGGIMDVFWNYTLQFTQSQSTVSCESGNK